MAPDSIEPTIPASAWIAETATVRGEVTWAEEVSVWFGAVIRGDVAAVSIGARSNVQDGAILHVSGNFPLQIGAGVTIGHGDCAWLHGGGWRTDRHGSHRAGRRAHRAGRDGGRGCARPAGDGGPARHPGARGARQARWPAGRGQAPLSPAGR